MTKPLVWIVDDDRSLRWVLEKALSQADFSVEIFEDGVTVANALNERRPDAILTDIRMPGITGLELLAKARACYPDLPIIVMTAHADMDAALGSYREGAFEYLPKPFDMDEAVRLVRRALEESASSGRSRAPSGTDDGPDIVGAAPSMQEVFRAIGRLSRTSLPVLINGESGTGKERVARALHNHSPRKDRTFVAINIAAIPGELLESELFGHEKGAFTGAQARRLGRFEQANGGTLFLDEIGDMPLSLQASLLRVLQDGRFFRVGGADEVTTDVRVIAATNQNLEQRVEDGRFREDLFHRLNVVRVHLPPLRERREDIPLLLRHFLSRAARELGVEPKTLAPETEQHLTALDWPGNVRALENACRWLMVMAPGAVIGMDDLPPELKLARAEINTEWERALRGQTQAMLARGGEPVYPELNRRFERVLIEAALAATEGVKHEAAERLGWGRNTLTRKLKELGME